MKPIGVPLVLLSGSRVLRRVSEIEMGGRALLHKGKRRERP